MSQKLRLALGQDTGAIHWEFARKALESATGVPTVVGLRAHLDQASAPTRREHRFRSIHSWASVRVPNRRQCGFGV